MAGYANPRVDELIEKIQTEMVTYGRDAYLEEAWRIVTNNWSTSRNPPRCLGVRHARGIMDIPPDPWDVPRFRLARFK